MTALSPENGAEPSTNPRGTKRRAEGSPGGRTPTLKRGLLEPLLNLFSPSSRNVQAPAPKEAATVAETSSPAPFDPLPVDPYERNVEIARRIDAAAAQRADEVAEMRLKDPKRKLKHNPNITKHDEAWAEARETFQAHLQKKGSTVSKVMDDHFEEAQLLYLQPSAQDGVILKIQDENTAKYKEALGPTGKFAGVPDNLATKLTMLHFGLPIEPLTMNNILNCSNDEDADDEPDEPEDMPGIHRIMYAEKPLEFLDKYHERSFGFPMLRIAKPRYQNAPANRPETEAVQPGVGPQDHHDNHQGQGNTPHNSPIQPGPSRVGMRGGGGTPYDLGAESESRSESEPVVTPYPTYSGHIYGYNGMLLVQNTSESFLSAALQLLGIDYSKQDSWAFHTFIHTSELICNVKVNEQNYEEVFQTKIKGHLDRPPTPDWPVFVCFGASCPNIMEPSRATMQDIVRLTRKGWGTSYWKLPRNIVPEYGINQSQPEFFRAMKLLFDPALPRPRGSVHIDLGKHGFDLGFGGMEATVDLWQTVLEEYRRVSGTEDQTVDLTVTITRAEVIKEGNVGSHLTGSHHEAQGSFTDQKYTLDEICDMSKTWLAQGSKASGPTAFRIWHNAEERERNDGSQVIEFKPAKTAIDSLGRFLAGWENRSHCIWWRPEWKTFSVEDLDVKNNRVEWDSTELQSLKGFRECLKGLWKDPDAVDSFTIVDAQSKEDGRKFVVTRDTDDTEWRMHIYDWLHSNRLFVRRNAGIIRDFDYTSWGGPEILPDEVAPADEPTPQSAPWDRSHSDPQSDPSIQRQRTLDQGMPGALRINRPRIVAAQAGKPKVRKYAEWASEQHFQDSLQRRSWTKDQSVVEPGMLPAAPLYGPSRELQIRVGDSMPTFYAQRLTPGDIRLLFDENQSLRNRVLDRMCTCPICDIEFEGYENDKMRDHFKQHQDQMREACDCPYCGDSQWIFMTMDEKRAHMLWHTDYYVASKIKNFYKDQRCPVCDRDFSSMEPEDIMRHCLDHPPGLVRYCDRCGLDEKDCNSLELTNHKQVCRNAPERRDGDPEPVFCKRCGQDRTSETHAEHLTHQSYCGSNPAGKFCTRCGLDETNPIIWNQAAIWKHNTHCTPPRGYKKQFCSRCRANLSTMDESQLSLHRHSCYLSEPPQQSEAERIKVLMHRQEETRAMNAEVNSKKAYVDRRTEEQDARERDLARRERDVLVKEDEYSSLHSRVDALSQLNRSRAIDPDDNDLGACPFDLCSTNIGKLSRRLLAAHLKAHANNTASFRCPLKGPDDEHCNHPLSLAHDGFDLTTHYVHKHSAAQQAAIKKAGQGEFAALRSLISRTQSQVEDSNAFLAQRQQHLPYPKTPARRQSANDAATDAGKTKKLALQVQQQLAAAITAQASRARSGHIDDSPSRAEQSARKEKKIAPPNAATASPAVSRKRKREDDEGVVTASGSPGKKASTLGSAKIRLKIAVEDDEDDEEEEEEEEEEEGREKQASGRTTRSVVRAPAPAARKDRVVEESTETEDAERQAQGKRGGAKTMGRARR